MTEYRAKAHGFNSEITAIVEVENGEILKISAEGEVPNTVGALGVDNWLEEANAEHSVEVDAISGASVSTGALRKATQMAYAEATSGDVDAISSASIHNQPNNYPLLKEKFYFQTTSGKSLFTPSTARSRSTSLYSYSIIFSASK